VDKSNESGTVLSVKQKSHRRQVIVTDRLLVDRFGADSNACSIIETLSKHLAFITWMANEAAPSESFSVLLDRRTFDEMQVQAVTWSAIIRMKAPVQYKGATALALTCLEDTTMPEGRWNILAAAAAFLVYYTSHVLPDNIPVTPQTVQSWLYQVALCHHAWH